MSNLTNLKPTLEHPQGLAHVLQPAERSQWLLQLAIGSAELP